MNRQNTIIASMMGVMLAISMSCIITLIIIAHKTFACYNIITITPIKTAIIIGKNNAAAIMAVTEGILLTCISIMTHISIKNTKWHK